jgi:hypothetical protein
MIESKGDRKKFAKSGKDKMKRERERNTSCVFPEPVVRLLSITQVASLNEDVSMQFSSLAASGWHCWK